MNVPLTVGLSCPRCRSQRTVLTERRFGQHRWFCGTCEHSWVLSGDVMAAPQPSIRPEEGPADT